MTNATFLATSKPLTCLLDDTRLHLPPKAFSTGSVGWYANMKGQVLVGEEYLPVQMSLTVTVIGSKNKQMAAKAPSEPATPSSLFDEPSVPLNAPNVPTGLVEPANMPTRPVKVRKKKD